MGEQTNSPDNSALYSSSIINTYVKLLKKHYPHVRTNEILSQAGIKSYQVHDERHWFSQKQVDRFFSLLVTVTGNNNIAREAGRYSASPEAMGTMTKSLMGFIGPARLFEYVEKVAADYTRSARFSSKKIGKNAIELTVTPYEGVEEKPYQCENRIGYFEAIINLFHERLPRIEHPECIFNGGRSCRYIVSWQNSPAALMKKWGFIASLALIAFLLYSVFFLPEFPFPWASLASISAIFILNAASGKLERKELVSAIEKLRDSNNELIGNLRLNYNHALMTNEIGQSISKQLQTDEILSRVIEILKKRLDFDRGLLLLATPDKSRLQFKTGYGYTPGQMKSLRAAQFRLDKTDSRGIFVVCYREQTPYLINDVEEILDDLSARSLDFAKKMGSKSFICCPIIYEEQCLGVLAVDNKITKRPLLQSDIDLLMGITPAIGISLRNAFLMENQEKQFFSILKTLAASIDARDFLTAGHSEKVTEYSVAICRELNLSREFTEMIRVASQLHDYGKIGIRDSILKKTGPLSTGEREEFKTHAEKTETILQRINFEGIYREVPMIAGSHHERIDGNGYPRGLKGEEIPLGARIIAVADYFEAITARRHYREPMSEEEAIDTLLEASGQHLDSNVVQAFLRCQNLRQKPHDKHPREQSQEHPQEYPTTGPRAAANHP